ncbi:MAG: YqaJ viral recombinase family protein [Candidatus Neomicrothrix subdominans]
MTDHVSTWDNGRTVATADAVRAEWLAWRRGGIGASDIAALLGLSPWSSPFAVWADKLALLPDEDLSDDDPREFGRRAEAMLGPWFADSTGLHLAGTQPWASNPAEPWMLATPDGVVVGRPNSNIDDALGGLEIKVEFDHRPWDDIPPHYQAQGQWQMAVTGWERVWFAVLHGRRFRVYELKRDQADIDMMTDRARTFWLDHVLARVAPPIDGSDATADVLRTLYPNADKGQTVELGIEAIELRDAYVDAKATAKDAEARAQAVANEIKAVMGEAYEATAAGSRVWTLGTQTRKTTCRHCAAVDESAPFRVLRIAKEKTR